MICIKKIICLIFCIFLISCAERSAVNPFRENGTLTGTYSCNGESFSVTVTCTENSVTVTPEFPKGYSVTFTENGVKTAFDGIEFESDKPDASRFYPLFEMARGINTKITETTLKHSSDCIFKDFK